MFFSEIEPATLALTLIGGAVRGRPTPHRHRNGHGSACGENDMTITGWLATILTLFAVLATACSPSNSSPDTDTSTPAPRTNPTSSPTPEPAASATPTSVIQAIAGSDKLDEPYRNAGYGFEIRPPSGWMVDESGALGTLVILFSPTVDKYQDLHFTANVNILADRGVTVGLEDYVAEGIEALPSLLSDFKLLKAAPITVNGHEGHSADSTFTQGSFPRQVPSIPILKGRHGVHRYGNRFGGHMG